MSKLLVDLTMEKYIKSQQEPDTGSPAAPPPFDPPKTNPGKRGTLEVYCSRTKKYHKAKNCLYRCDDPMEAYWPIEDKQSIDTIYGHVEICWVLDRRTIGGGVFRRTSQRVAIKVYYGDRIENLRESHIENPLNELACMQLVGNDNPHVIGVIDDLDVAGDLNIVMPYASQGDLFGYLYREHYKKGHPLPEHEARTILRQIVSGVRHLHNHGICHRDLSPENVMIDDDMGCVIIDMGLALRMPYTTASPDGTTRAVVPLQIGGNRKQPVEPQPAAGKLSYMSPEIFQEQPFDGEAIDVWTLGIILFFMVTSRKPYQHPLLSDPGFWHLTKNLDGLLEAWGISISDDCLDLLSQMLSVDPSVRATLDEVQEHPWMDH